MTDLVRRAGIFLIAAKTMYHFAAGSRYERYVRLLIRLMTLAVMLIPVLDFIKAGTRENFTARLAQFEMQYEKMTGNAEFAERDMTLEKIMPQAQEEIRSALSPLIAQYGYRIKETALRTDRLYFLLVPEDYESDISILPIGEVHIADGDASQGNKHEEVMKSVIAARLGVGEEWVEVRILE